MKMTRPIHDAFIPLGGSGAPGLPGGMLLRGDCISYNGHEAQRSLCPEYVREDGPGAFGSLVRVPAGAYYKWDYADDWICCDEESRFWITLVGNRLDIIEVEDGVPRWTSHIGTEY